MAIKLTTVSADVTIDDLGARTFVHPTVEYDLVGSGEFTESEIKASADMQAAIDGNTITLKDDNNNPITNLESAGPHNHVKDDVTDFSHAASHVGADSIVDATPSQKGLATAAQIDKLNGIASGADVTGANPPQAHAASHTDGTDDIQSATAGQKGLATATQIAKLNGIETGADVTDVANVEAAGAVMKTLVDAKGDLLVATADDIVTRLPVGTDDQVLSADSAEATGLKWVDSSGGTPSDQPAFSARKDGDQTLTGSYADVTSWLTPDEITSDFSFDTLTGVVTINTTGLYLVHFATTTEVSTGTDRSGSRIKMQRDAGVGYNDIPSSIQGMYNRNATSGYTNAAWSRVLELSSGDMLKMQAIQDSGVDTVFLESDSTIMNIVKLSGTKGDKGDTGSGSNITVEDEGTPVTGTPHSILDFKGALVAATNAGGGQADISIGGDANDLDDVSAASPSENDHLVRNGSSQWVNVAYPKFHGKLTRTQMLAISSPTAGDTCWCTTYNKMFTYGHEGGTTWQVPGETIEMTNEAVGTFEEGDICVLDDLNDESIDITTTAYDGDVVGIIVIGGANGVACTVAVKGKWDVYFQGVATRTNWVTTSTTAGYAQNVAGSSDAVIGQVIEATGGAGLAKCWLFGKEAY